MVIEKDWEAHFAEFDDWKPASEVEPMPLFDPGSAPARPFVIWDDPEYLPRRDTIKIYVASDLASTRPVQIELEYWFSYEAGKIISRYTKTPCVRFRLLMIYGKGDTPDPETITPMSGRGKQLTKIERHFKTTLRHAMTDAILEKLGATPEEVMGLSSVIRRHTTVNMDEDEDRG